MKEITKKSLQNLWDYCKEAYDESEQASKFFTQIDMLLGKGDVDFDLVMDFVRANKIKRAAVGSRAKTVTSPGRLHSPEYKAKHPEKFIRNPVLPKQPRSRNAYPGYSCGQSSGGCDAPVKRNYRRSDNDCGGSSSNAGC